MSRLVETGRRISTGGTPTPGARTYRAVRLRALLGRGASSPRPAPRLAVPADRRPRGQSLVEFALVLPILLLLTLIAVDFGRVYLGWVNLQNMARIAANYAANNPTAWPSDSTRMATYQTQIRADAKATNCTLPLVGGVPTAPDPTFPSGTEIGGTAVVHLSCSFQIITPIISSIVGSGGFVTVGADSTFPIKSGQFSINPATPVAPVADFIGSPTTIVVGSGVQFTDKSTGGPTNWAWDFGDGGTSIEKNPLHAYTSVGSYTVTLQVSNSVGSDTRTRISYINVNVAPVADFSGTPTAGSKPLKVDFSDLSTGNPTAWTWDFGDGTGSTTGPTVSHTYNNAGSYTVRLTVTTASGPATVTKSNYIVVSVGTCTVPSFVGNVTSSGAQSLWASYGFTTSVQFDKPGNSDKPIVAQSLTGNSVVPCDSTITLTKGK